MTDGSQEVSEGQIPIFLLLLPSCFTARQDIAFFDAKKTGQLVSRLTTDVQEFKSSFKLVISQVSGSGPCARSAARLACPSSDSLKLRWNKAVPLPSSQ